MRIQIRSILVIAMAGICLLQSCRDKTVEEITYTANVPLYLSPEQMQESIKVEDPKELTTPGKIHINGNRLFIVDRFQGIHIFDNGDPSNPQNIAYINLPGVIDIATRGNMLYADSYTDLLTIDMGSLSEIEVVDRESDVFVQVLPPTNNEYPISEIDETRGMVVGWKVQEVTEIRDVDHWSPMWGWRETTTAFSDQATGGGGGFAPTSVPNMNNGTSGSMARFTMSDAYLYAVNGREILTYNVNTLNDPVFESRTQVNRDVETLFPLDERLFVGTTSGMVIYGLDNPAQPAFISDFNHSTSCDPVVVEGDYAYVTLRSGTNCGGWTNQLDVIDISNIASPQLVSSYQMTNPHGVGISNDVLFLCDGEDGLKVYDATDKWSIDQNLIAHFQNIQSYDVIPLQEVLLMVGEQGFYQYDYSDLENIHLISEITVE